MDFFLVKRRFEVNNHEKLTEDRHHDRGVAKDRRGNRNAGLPNGFQRRCQFSKGDPIFKPEVALFGLILPLFFP
jgi:hypothetical protein